MAKAQHFVSISGGKDSTAVACIAVERAEKRPDFAPRFLFADTGNEHDLTLEYVEYLGRSLGITIETVKADFSGRFAARRERIAKDWPKELRRKMHTTECRDACSDLAYAKKALVREECDCPIKVSAPVSADRVALALDSLKPSGNPFLDMGMLHGRFPSKMLRFCTEELKIEPIDAVVGPLRFAGTPVIQWIGERAQESQARANKSALEITRCAFRAPQVLYRPIHSWKHEDVFAIAKRHGLKPNPLYLMGMGRVGCMPCIMAGKDELAEIVRRFPEVIDRIEEWEAKVSVCSRRGGTTFMAADKVPGTDDQRAAIRNVAEWTKTSRGGRQFDLLNALNDEAHHACRSKYGQCE